MNNIILKCESVSFGYSDKLVLKNVSLSLEKGEIGVILGASGCGKTTLLRIIGGLEKNHLGSIEIEQKVVSSKKEFVDPQKRKIGYVFQDYALFPHLTVAQNITFGLNSSQSKATVLQEMLSLFKMEEKKDFFPHQLSGGQQQRVAIARSLAVKPEILLMDEPFSNLDIKMRGELLQELGEIFKKIGTSCLIVTHEIGEAFSFADKMGVLVDGALLQWQTPKKMFFNPISKKIVEILQSGNLLGGEFAQNKFHSCLGIIDLDLTSNLPVTEEPKYCLFLPHGAIKVCAEGKYLGKLTKVQFNGKSNLCEILYAPNLHFLIIESADFAHLPNENIQFDINKKLAVLLPID